jgi:drug/metabolite transporter (DMT)-like permease
VKIAPGEVEMEARSARPANRIARADGGADDRAVPQHDYATAIAFAAVVLLGGSVGVAIRVSNVGLPPFWGAGMRCGLAGLIFWIVVAFRRVKLPRRGALVGALLYGLLSVSLGYGLTYWALVKMGAGVASVILPFVPLMTHMLARAHGLETFRWRGLLGCLVAIAGVLFAMREGLGTSVPLGPLLALVGGAASQAEASVLFKLYPKPHPHATNAIALSSGAVPLLGLSLIVGEEWSLPSSGRTWVALGYLVIFATVGVSHLYLFVLRRWAASAANYSFLLFPISAMALAAWILGEVITASFVIGGVAVLAGVWLGALSGPRRLRDPAGDWASCEEVATVEGRPRPRQGADAPGGSTSLRGGPTCAPPVAGG